MTTTISHKTDFKTSYNQDDFLEYALRHQFGEIHCKVDVETGMKAIIAIHNTKLGPALGGCRFIEYPDTTTALHDAMRLARGMSYKSAIAKLPLGGGKSVMIKPPHAYNRDAYFHRFGEFIHSLNGRYITALDSGTQLADMDIIAQHTPYVASLSCHDGDPSFSTARGILRGIEAAVFYQLNKDNLNGLHIAIQGLGHVGFLLARHVTELGARITVADIDSTRTELVVKEFGATVVSVNDIHKVPCDVFAPCALGAIINDTTIKEFQTTIIAGAANNQLAHTYHGQLLHEKGILYAPDYVINAGGVIFASGKYFHTAEQLVHEHIDGIRASLLQVFARATQENRPTSDIADRIASEILAE
ncbi:MAG: amino acid dehydrogenase [Legionellaceae bacterium]|nr:amino acid dehydrogenase [Legionellaceae bacterium]